MKQPAFFILLLYLLLALGTTVACSGDESSDNPVPSSEPKILGFRLEGIEMELPVEINQEEKTINAYVLSSVDITALVPQFEVSEGASVSPKPGVSYNFTNPLTFQVVGSDKSFANYVVQIQPIAAELLSFQIKTGKLAIPFDLRPGIITKTGEHQYSVQVFLHHDDPVTDLETIAEISDGGSITPNPSSVSDYSQPVAFEVADSQGNANFYTVEVTSLPEQEITVTPSSDFDENPGVQFFNISGPYRYDQEGNPLALQGYAITIDMTQGYDFVPFYDKEIGNLTVTEMSASYETATGNTPLAAINTGYFGGNSSYSLVISNQTLLATNVPTLTRSDSYYVTRGALGLNDQGIFDVSWVYTIGTNETYGYPVPSLNVDGQTPMPQPSATFPEGGFIYDRIHALGGGPVLIRDGILIENYDYELFYDDIKRSVANRTAVGVTDTNELVLLVIDGRADYSAGMALDDMAVMLKEQFHCVHALNFDGGGSSTLVVKGALRNQNALENGERNVLSGLLIVPKAN